MLELDLPSWLSPAPGPAGLLCHAHDDQLWKLRSFGVRGAIERRDGQWVRVPHRYVGGMGKGGPIGFVRLLRTGRKGAAEYLRRRGLPRPAIPWDEYAALQQARETDAR